MKTNQYTKDVIQRLENENLETWEIKDVEQYLETPTSKLLKLTLEVTQKALEEPAPKPVLSREALDWIRRQEELDREWDTAKAEALASGGFWPYQSCRVCGRSYFRERVDTRGVCEECLSEELKEEKSGYQD